MTITSEALNSGHGYRGPGEAQCHKCSAIASETMGRPIMVPTCDYDEEDLIVIRSHADYLVDLSVIISAPENATAAEVAHAVSEHFRESGISADAVDSWGLA